MLNRPQVLQQVARAATQLTNLQTQSNIVASTAVLAGLVLEKELIERILRRELMRESVIYQDILQEEALSLILRLLNRRVGTVSPELQLQIQSLPLEQLESLAEALLDFSNMADLVNWLQEHPVG